MMRHLEAREELIRTVRRMNDLGINHGNSGNASVRIDGGFLITPSGLAYEDLTPEDIVEMRFDGTAEGRWNPSSEWRFHRDLLAAREDFNAILHTHGVAVMTLACLRMELPPFHYMIAMAGGNTIRCARYATYGTQVLSDNALDAMRDRKACLLANHGLLVGEASLRQALALALEVETLCEAYVRILQTGHPPVLLSDEEMDEVRAQFAKGYGLPGRRE